MNYWIHLYKDPQLSIQERYKIVNKIRNTCLKYENRLMKFQYETTIFGSDGEDSADAKNFRGWWEKEGSPY